MSISEIKKNLQKYSDSKRAINFRKFFKNSKKDIFLGVPTATIRKIAKQFYTLALTDVLKLMKSNVHDERNLAHAILFLKYKKGDDKIQARIFKFYIKNKNTIRDWDSVDDTAPYIVGPYLFQKDKSLLYKLAHSKRIWDRRIAIVSTWWFIRQNEFKDTLAIAKLLLADKEDLIQKPVGWMLREVGKRDEAVLKRFLDKHCNEMPRTMLRYAIERLTLKEKQKYMFKK